MWLGTTDGRILFPPLNPWTDLGFNKRLKTSKIKMVFDKRYGFGCWVFKGHENLKQWTLLSYVKRSFMPYWEAQSIKSSLARLFEDLFP